MLTDITVIQAKRYGVFSCSEDTSLGDATETMVREDISGLVVVDDDGFLKGIITRTDLLRACKTWSECASRTVREFMSSSVITVSPQDSLDHVAEVLIGKNIHRVVIVEQEGDKLRPVGVISDADLVYHMNKIIRSKKSPA